MTEPLDLDAIPPLPLDEQLTRALTDEGFDETDTAHAIRSRVYSRWLAWYEGASDYQPTDGVSAAIWPNRDSGESMSHYIVRCDVPDLLELITRLTDALAAKQERLLTIWDEAYDEGMANGGAEALADLRQRAALAGEGATEQPKPARAPEPLPVNECFLSGPHEAHDWWYTSSGGGHMLSEAAVGDPNERGQKQYRCPGKGAPASAAVEVEDVTP